MQALSKRIRVEEAAEQLGISHWTLRKRCRDRLVTHQRFGKLLFIPQSEIDRILAEGHVERIA